MSLIKRLIVRQPVIHVSPGFEHANAVFQQQLKLLDMLQDLIVAATNEALKKAGDMVQSEMSEITGGMNIPGMF